MHSLRAHPAVGFDIRKPGLPGVSLQYGEDPQARQQVSLQLDDA
jgi:hypothetical protein